MAHFAQLDESNIVTQVIVVNNDALDLENEEASGIAFCQSLFGGNWIQTSYNNNIRFNYAGIGYTYDSVRDAFISPKSNCHEEEILDEETCRWVCSNAEHNEVNNGGN